MFESPTPFLAGWQRINERFRELENQMALFKSDLAFTEPHHVMSSTVPPTPSWQGLPLYSSLIVYVLLLLLMPFVSGCCVFARQTAPCSENTNQGHVLVFVFKRDWGRAQDRPGEAPFAIDC